MSDKHVQFVERMTCVAAHVLQYTLFHHFLDFSYGGGLRQVTVGLEIKQKNI